MTANLIVPPAIEEVIAAFDQSLDALDLPTPVRYFGKDEGGVSHFHYLRDNALLTWMHTRLVFESLLRMPVLLWRKLRRSSS